MALSAAYGGATVAGAGSVTTTEILDSTILAEDLADGAVTFAKMAAGTLALAADGETTSIAVGDGMGSASAALRCYSFGIGALEQLVGGDDNIGVGFDAGKKITSGINNCAIGSYALDANITGSDNTAVGKYALSTTTNVGNTALGSGAGLLVSSGANNLLLGKNAGNAITTGANNSIVGSYSGTTGLASNVVLATGAGVVVFRYNGTNWFFGDGVSALPIINPGISGALWVNTLNARALSVSA